MMKTVMLFTVICTIIIQTALARKKSVFKSDKINQRRADPNRDTIYDEYLVFFDEDCLDQKDASGRDIITEFLDKYECYKWNERRSSQYRKIGDYFILLDRIQGCIDKDEDSLEWDDYCIVDVDENEEVHLCASSDDNVCRYKTVTAESTQHERVMRDVSVGASSYPYILYGPRTDPGFDIIVMDQGIDFSHSEFEGIEFKERLYPKQLNPQFDQKLWPHGTHVAGIIVGKTYGVFPARSTTAKLIDVNVAEFDSNANTHTMTDSEVINGYKAIISHLWTTKRKAIINMSFEGGNSNEKDRLLKLIRDTGGMIFAAAGNAAKDASNTSPASSSDVITVGNYAPDKKAELSSNYGSAVNIWAPGHQILSSIPNEGAKKMTGTSMASPFAAGVAASVWANSIQYPSMGINYDMTKMIKRLHEYGEFDIDDRQGHTDLPRVLLSCELYCNSHHHHWHESLSRCYTE